MKKKKEGEINNISTKTHSTFEFQLMSHRCLRVPNVEDVGVFNDNIVHVNRVELGEVSGERD